LGGSIDLKSQRLDVPRLTAYWGLRSLRSGFLRLTESQCDMAKLRVKLTVLKTGVVDEENAKKESTIRRAAVNILLGPEEI